MPGRVTNARLNAASSLPFANWQAFYPTSAQGMDLKMAILKKGILCVIVAGCPENIGLIVEIIEHLGCYDRRADAYRIKTVTGRPFQQLWYGDDLLRSYSNEAVTDRHKLRPLVDHKEIQAVVDATIQRPSQKSHTTQPKIAEVQS